MVRAPLARVNGDKRRDVLVSCWPPIDNVKPIWRRRRGSGCFAFSPRRRRSGSGAWTRTASERVLHGQRPEHEPRLHNFLYNSFDPAGFISVDKPPVALLIQSRASKLFGFHALSVLIPRLWRASPRSRSSTICVQRRFGPPPACWPLSSSRSRRSTSRSIARATPTAAWCWSFSWRPGR